MAVAARVPLLPSKRLELLAMRVPHFGEHLGTCARVRTCTCACASEGSSRTPWASVRRRYSAMSTPPWSSSSTLAGLRRRSPRRASLQRIEFSCAATKSGQGAMTVQRGSRRVGRREGSEGGDRREGSDCRMMCVSARASVCVLGEVAVGCWVGVCVWVGGWGGGGGAYYNSEILMRSSGSSCCMKYAM